MDGVNLPAANRVEIGGQGLWTWFAAAAYLLHSSSVRMFPSTSMKEIIWNGWLGNLQGTKVLNSP